jgi:hypothetical protein
MSTVIRTIELETAWVVPRPRGSSGQIETRPCARVTLKRDGERRLSHEVFTAETHSDALRALAAAIDRGYPDKPLEQVADRPDRSQENVPLYGRDE